MLAAYRYEFSAKSLYFISSFCHFRNQYVILFTIKVGDVHLMIKCLPEVLKSLGTNIAFPNERLFLILAFPHRSFPPMKMASIHHLLALSYRYKCSADYLLGKESEPPKNILNTDKPSHKQLQMLSNLIDSRSSPHFQSYLL